MNCLLNPEKLCDDCGACNRCDLNPEKLCDNCFRCLEPEAGKDYLDVPIGAVYDETDLLHNQMASACMTYLHIQTRSGISGRRCIRPRKKKPQAYYNED